MYRVSAILLTSILLNTASAAWAHDPPTKGWTIHIDAKRHIAGDLDAVAHHYCKGGLPGGVIQCQLYDSDAPNARLVGVEVVIPAEAYATLAQSERDYWHYHKEELGLVDPTLPEMSPEEAANFAKSIEETYGKIFLIWDTPRDELPIGQPQAYDIADHATQ